ncbi:hypothetical protein [Mycobacteroides abscessus]|uniref:hypothetical protein n=1 Tax=Mycobacteroides abscessus TaxID=36809 RepID=UPI00031CC5C1|nr:hypothetical protein [Mycobacteroides abscessus]AMU29993.1 hypothetical protein A3N97_04825 [Mycobacteroides abscessus]AMU74254.1 hypothetical protein A3O06_05965 [Mycobacteroides abscessus]ANN98091.1 hypothetical protein BAB74_04530 [Mycobacteroides abscessus]ANO23191.1 hypothetical protein BAB79_05960 [Mycobacteroides abscessus]MBN7303172.1 hypothetical protein [Mycobacteroides abscessus subsp. bolletii]
MPSDDHREYIKKMVDAAPPLTPEQRARLRMLLSPVAVEPLTDATTYGITVEFGFESMSTSKSKV